MDYLVQKILEQQLNAFKTNNCQLLNQMHRLLSGIMRLISLFGAFQSNYNSASRVAKKFGISRVRIYQRLEALRLSPKDFKETETLSGLILRSPILRKGVDPLMSQNPKFRKLAKKVN